MLYLYAINGFVTYSVLVFIIASVLSFFRRDGFLLKVNLKLAGICIVFVIIFSLFSVFPNNDTQLLYMMFGLVLSISFSIFINKARIDLVSLKELRLLIIELKTLRHGDSSSYKRDHFSTTKIIIGYIILFLIISTFNFDGKVASEILIIVVGAIHALLFSKLWGVCPYCNYKVHNITRRTASIHCRVCKSTIVMHGNKLTRPLGRGRSKNY